MVTHSKMRGGVMKYGTVEDLLLIWDKLLPAFAKVEVEAPWYHYILGGVNKGYEEIHITDKINSYTESSEFMSVSPLTWTICEKMCYNPNTFERVSECIKRGFKVGEVSTHPSNTFSTRLQTYVDIDNGVVFEFKYSEENLMKLKLVNPQGFNKEESRLLEEAITYVRNYHLYSEIDERLSTQEAASNEEQDKLSKIYLK